MLLCLHRICKREAWLTLLRVPRWWDPRATTGGTSSVRVGLGFRSSTRLTAHAGVSPSSCFDFHDSFASHTHVSGPRWRSPSTIASRWVLGIWREHGPRGTGPRARSASPILVPPGSGGRSRVTCHVSDTSSIGLAIRGSPGSNRKDLQSRIGWETGWIQICGEACAVVAVGTMASERTSPRGRRQLDPAATHEPEGGTKRWKKHGNQNGRGGAGSQEESGSERSTQEVLERRDWLEDLRQERGREKKPLPLRQINHISRVCSSLSKSLEFYRDVLGFVEIKRPDSFDFDGAWLFNYGIGIHLLKLGNKRSPRQLPINPKGDHISFTCDSLLEVESSLTRHGINYVKSSVVEHMVKIEQVFFHDPDGNMIEVCTCDCLPVTPLGNGRQCMRRCPSFTVGEGAMEQIVEELQRQQLVSRARIA